MSNVEVLKLDLANASPPPEKAPIDYMGILEKLGLEESALSPDIIERLKNHLTLYKNGVEANMALLEEKVAGKTPEARLTDWMETEAKRIAETAAVPSVETATALVQEAATTAQDAVANFEADQLQRVNAKLAASTTLAGLSKIPYIGSSLVETLSSWLINTGKDMQSGSAGFFSKIFFGIFAGALGIKEILAEKAPVVPTATVPSPEVPVVPEAVPVAAEDVKTASPDVSEGNGDTNESLKTSAFKAGINSLLGLSGVRMESNASAIKNTILDMMKGLSYDEIEEMKNSSLKKETFLQKLGTDTNYAPVLDQILEALSTQNTKDLIEISLAPAQLESILMPNGKENEKLGELLGETKEKGMLRLREIYASVKQGTFQTQSLSLNEISLFYLASFPALRVSMIPGIGNLGKELQDMGGEMDTLGEGLGVSFIDTGLVEKFAKIGALDFGGNDMLQDSFLKSKIGTLSESEAASLEKLIAFKNFLISPDFLNITKLGLSTEHKNAFLQNLNYQSIIALYEILGGNPTASSINAMALPSVVLTISHVIGKVGENGSQNAFLAASYLGGYAKDIAMGNTDKLGLAKDEQRILSIYSQKMLDVILFSYIMEFQAKLGAVEGVTGLELGQLALVSFGTGVGLNLLGNTLIKKGIESGKISFLGKLSKKLGWIGILFGIAAGGAELLQMNVSTGGFEKDLEEATKANDIQKAISVLQAHKENTHEYTIGGENLVITAYPGDTPLVFFRGRIWNFTILDESGSAEWSLEYVEGLIKDTLSEKTNTLEGEKGPGLVSDVKIENGNLVFGDNIQVQSMDTIFGTGTQMQEKQSENWAATVEGWLNSDIQEGERRRQILGADYIEFLKGDKATYIPLAQISEKSFIVIQAVGEYNTSNS